MPMSLELMQIWPHCQCRSSKDCYSTTFRTRCPSCQPTGSNKPVGEFLSITNKNW